jgi:NAD(P)-dependent dehydrogenase (short-subunit alcohol dehydrogenase family)
MNILNTNVLITGGSRGLGEALGHKLAVAGARVVLVARGSADLELAVQRIRKLGGEAHGIAADIADKREIHRIAHEAAALIGPIDILVNAASTLGPTPLRLLLDTECEDLEDVLQTNLVGPFRLTKLLVAGMAMRGRGLVVNVSSDAATEAYEAWGPYALSKAALDHLTRTFAAELDGSGVRFISVDPGEMDTQMHRDAIPGADPSSLARPADVAAQIVDMVSDAAGAPTGARLQAQQWEVRS